MAGKRNVLLFMAAVAAHAGIIGMAPAYVRLTQSPYHAERQRETTKLRQRFKIIYRQKLLRPSGHYAAEHSDDQGMVFMGGFSIKSLGTCVGQERAFDMEEDYPYEIATISECKARLSNGDAMVEPADILKAMRGYEAIILDQLDTTAHWIDNQKPAFESGAFGQQPFIQKMKLHQDQQCAIFGTIGDTRSVIAALRALGVHENFKLPGNTKIVFCSDLSGAEGARETLYLAWRLKIANPESVFLLRADHQIQEQFELTDLIKSRTRKKFDPNQQLREYSNQLIELQPVGLLVGSNSNFILICRHGLSFSTACINLPLHHHGDATNTRCPSCIMTSVPAIDKHIRELLNAPEAHKLFYALPRIIATPDERCFRHDDWPADKNSNRCDSENLPFINFHDHNYLLTTAGQSKHWQLAHLMHYEGAIRSVKIDGQEKMGKGHEIESHPCHRQSATHHEQWDVQLDQTRI